MRNIKFKSNKTQLSGGYLFELHGKLPKLIKGLINL